MLVTLNHRLRKRKIWISVFNSFNFSNSSCGMQLRLLVRWTVLWLYPVLSIRCFLEQKLIIQETVAIVINIYFGLNVTAGYICCIVYSSEDLHRINESFVNQSLLFGAIVFQLKLNFSFIILRT